MSLKSLIPKTFQPYLRQWLLGKGPEAVYTRPFFSQTGEDIILTQLVGAISIKEKGFFIDVGAFHPFEHSNTFKLYQSGWRGINIDPNPASIALFNRFRPEDINLNLGISNKPGLLPFYILHERSSMNTFSRENLEKLGVFNQVKEIIDVETKPLSAIIEAHRPALQDIHFLNIDTEGYEMEILQSLDWSSIHPRIIALEQNGVFGIESVMHSEPYAYLYQRQYVPVAMTPVTTSIATVFYTKKP